MTDEFSTLAQSALTPSEHVFAVTPDDTNALSAIPKYLYVGSGGDIALRAMDSAADAVFANVPSGGYIYVRASHVRATGTTAADIVACA